MQPIKKRILFLSIVFSTFIAFSQEKNDTVKKTIIPVSLYNLPQQTPSLISNYNINKSLHLTGFNFIILDKNDIENGFFTISASNFKREPSNYIYDDYQKIYRNMALKSAFFKGHDLMKPSIYPR
ncbi:MAG: hypothetical protein WC389_04505 [Lutibacter sp.]|jgi:hypothetical protein